MMTLQEFYQQQKQKLQQAGKDSAALDARLLICHVLGMTHEEFILRGGDAIAPDHIAAIDMLVQQRMDGKPVAKITGQKEFYGRMFKTTIDTLDPRPDSEVLIEAVLKNRDTSYPWKILDLGTGTGCLVLTLLAELPKARAVAVDQSPQALNVAKENSWTIGVEDRVVFAQSDWFSDVIGMFDIIISNPPYIPAGDIPGLAPDVRLYDPMAALVGGEDGLDPYRIMIPQLSRFLNPNGFAAFELGQGQAPMVAEILQNHGFSGVRTHDDLAGIGRVVSGTLAE